MSNPIRILVVDDDNITVSMFQDMLKHAGYIVVGHAANGDQAIAMTMALKPDVVLMDIKMPGMDGITCAEIISVKCPTPVILISGYDEPRLIERAKLAGVGAYMVKPVKPADLRRNITLVRARFQDLMKLRQLAAILECSEDAICSMTPDGIILNWNPAAERIYGYSAAEITGKPVARLLPPDRADEFDRLLEKIKRGEQIKVYETGMTGKNGKHIAVSVSIAPIRNHDSKTTCVAAIIRDITERKRAEEEARLNRQEMMRHEQLVTLGTLAAGVAHEINNPVHVILMNASVLQTILDDLVPVLDDLVTERADFMIGKLPYTTLKPNLLKIAKGISGAGQRISDIVAALKDFVRPDDPAHSFEPVDVNEVVRQALDLLVSHLRKSTHRFAVVYGANLPKLPKGRARKIEQVVINMLMNACQALSGPDKAVRVITGHEPDTNSLVITVEDEGSGIPSEIIAQIKDPFFTTRRSKGGTGLGLPISDAIVREHHGRLEFASREGYGTTARMVLPLNHADDTEGL